jgi:hypothetical protein
MYSVILCCLSSSEQQPRFESSNLQNPLQHFVKDESHIMASSPHNAASNRAKPWPAYFIVRTSGEVVPLIGVDELPVGTDLVGVPRALDLKDTLGMLNLGIQRSSEEFYQISQPQEKTAGTAETASKLA